MPDRDHGKYFMYKAITVRVPINLAQCVLIERELTTGRVELYLVWEPSPVSCGS